MNPRIQELANQAAQWADELPTERILLLTQWYDERLEKFFKLVVEECAEFLTDDLDYPDAALKLKQHFGVEDDT